MSLALARRAPRSPWFVLALGVAVGAAVSVGPIATVVVIVGAIGVALGASRPDLLVPLMFTGILFDKLGDSDTVIGVIPVTASKLCVVASLGLWTVHSVWNRVPPLRWHPVLSALVGVVLMTAVGVAWANCLDEGRVPLYGLAMVTVLTALVYTLTAEARLPGLYRLLGLVLCAVIAISLHHPSGPGEAARASGTFGDPNEWATMVLLLTPFLLGGLASDEHLLARPVRLGLLALAPIAVLSTESRAALIVSVVVVPASLFLMRRRRGELLACAAAAVAAVPFFVDLDLAFARFGLLLARLRGEIPAMDVSLDERTELFRQGEQLFLDNWFMGAGPGRFKSATGFIAIDGALRPAHNTYLEIAAEQGMVGLAVAGVFVATVALTLWRAWRGAANASARARVFGAAAGLLALALMAGTLGLSTFAMGYLVLGLTLATAEQARAPSLPPSAGRGAAHG